MVTMPKSQFAITIMAIIAIALIIIAILIRKILEYRDIIIDLIDYIDDTYEIEEIYNEVQIQDQYLNKQIINRQIQNQKSKKDGK